MRRFKSNIISFIFVFGFGLFAGAICQLFTEEPTDRYIHVRSFRYGKIPYKIRCNRRDTLHLTFSTDDTGHSFFLEEFDVDAKVSPASDEVTIFKVSDPSDTPVIAKELIFTAKHPGILNFIISKSNYRCHVWCGPMHAFEQGKLIILPNTLLSFSIGSLIGIIFLWLVRIFRNKGENKNIKNERTGYKDLLNGSGFIRRIILSRWPQIILTIITLVMIYIVIMTSVFGTKVSGRNLGVLMMWAIWLFLLIAVITPLGGRSWCTICPLPFFGDWFQRRSFFSPLIGRTKNYNNKFYGLFLKWPEWLSNSWIKLIVFLILATFSTTLVATPKISGITVLMLLIVPTIMAFIWELRAFCRYVCPVSVFVSPFSEMSFIALRNKFQSVCDECKPNYCENGSKKGWACPYGLNVGKIKENADCGLCLECTRSCLYENIIIYKRPFGPDHVSRNMSEAWLTIALFTISILYSILYLGPWPAVRDYVNILDKQNWDLFEIYSLVLWSLVLGIIPGILYLLAGAGARLSGKQISTKEVFLSLVGSLMPLGFMLWIAFVIPMLTVNITFIFQSASDPFGWGWDFFGTANIPWHQFLPMYVPWFQALFILTGLYLSLRNISHNWESRHFKSKHVFLASLPFSLFIISATVMMLFFFTD